MLAASDFSLETSWKQAEKGTLSPLECLSFANNIQADLPTCGYHLLDHDSPLDKKNLVIERNARNLNKICSYVNGFN